jgi:hypothetical protein
MINALFVIPVIYFELVEKKRESRSISSKVAFVRNSCRGVKKETTEDFINLVTSEN